MVWQRGVVLKTSQEIEIMREAGKINALALKTVRDMIRPGVATSALDAAAEEVIRDHGAKPTFLGFPGPYPFPATLTISINEELVHGIPGSRVLRSGDIVSIDCGTTYRGFVGDSAFSMGVGQVSDQAKKLLKVTKESLYAGIEQMKPGNRVGDISAAVQQHVEAHGFQVPRSYTGHGVGREMHEAPQVPNFGRAGRGLVLRPGITLAVEPMVLMGSYHTQVQSDQWTVTSADGSLTAHFEHTIAVVEDGSLILTA
ncbi:MAG: type I methionyl aminopeptidase [Anaerolineae bacterium]|nr:type I methionyl aminopeptidase [Anaerolineae bacterium]